MFQKNLKLLCSARSNTIQLADGLLQEQSDFVPARGKWSAGEVLDHIILAERLYYNKFSILVELQKAGKKSELRSDFSEIDTSILFVPKAVLPLLEIPLTVLNTFMPKFVREKMTQYRVMPAQTPSVADPQWGRDIKQVQLELRLSLQQTVELFEKNPDLDYQRMLFSHPLMGKNNALEMLRILALHEQRHLNQVRDILQAPAFPSSELASISGL